MEGECHMNKPRSSFATAGLILSAAACLLSTAATAAPLENPRVPPPGQSAAFTDGYVAGCQSGYIDADRDGFDNTTMRDERRFAVEPEYNARYQQAYAACFDDEKHHPRMKSDGNNRR